MLTTLIYRSHIRDDEPVKKNRRNGFDSKSQEHAV